MPTDLYIGLMSGTSLDGIDAVLTSFENNQPRLIEKLFQSHDDEIRKQIQSLVVPGKDEINRLAELDIRFAKLSVNVIHKLLKKAGVSPDSVKAIGSHGQTIRHFPDSEHPTTLQVGDPNTIAELTGITTVADFRRRDMAAGGQGAPLLPIFHRHIFHSEKKNRIVLNIGGIANVTLLPTNASKVTGFDTGTGNTLLNYWIGQHKYLPFDDKGEWARSGEVSQGLLDHLLEEPYFSQSPPKSTGTEYFSSTWLMNKLSSFESLSPEDIQATLTALTTTTIANTVKEYATGTREIILCGGGAHNNYLIDLLTRQLTGIEINSSDKYGVDPDFVEATAFAWLARQALEQQPGNLPSVTGATHPVILGGVYY